MDEKLVFDVAWYDEPMEAQEAVSLMRRFFHRLQVISPWCMPFDISGSTARLSHLAFREDYSDFEELTYRCMVDPELRYFSKSHPDEKRFLPDSTTPLGFRAFFSDYPQRNGLKDAVKIVFHVGGDKPNFVNTLLINIPKYQTENASWTCSELEIPDAIFEFLIDFFAADTCNLATREFQNDFVNRKTDRFHIGWMTYTTNKQAADALKDDPRCRPYGDGVIIRLGDGPHVLKDPQARAAALEIRDKLIKADAARWW